MLQMKHCRTLRTKAKQWDSGSHQFIQLTFSEDIMTDFLGSNLVRLLDIVFATLLEILYG